jgi:hypothetical protein
VNEALVLRELTDREPLFHRRNIVSCEQEFLAETASDFWEVGASGATYDRATVLRELQTRWESGDVDDADAQGWITSDHRVQVLADRTYLFTYTLHDQGRVTRRTTIWRRTTDQRWHACFHQGTVVQHGATREIQ